MYNSIDTNSFSLYYSQYSHYIIMSFSVVNGCIVLWKFPVYNVNCVLYIILVLKSYDNVIYNMLDLI